MNYEHLEGGSVRRTDDPGEPQTGVPRISIAEEEARILAQLAHNRTVLEIGTGLGISTRALATDAIHVHTYDIDPWVHHTIWPTLPTNCTGIDDKDFCDADIDMVFIDGDHSTKATVADIQWAEERLWPGGIIAVHDTNYPNVAAALTGEGWHHINTTHGISWKEI